MRRVVESGGRSGWTRAGLRERAGAHWDELRGWIAQQGRRGEGRTISALIDPATQVKGASPGTPLAGGQEQAGEEALAAPDAPASMSPGGQKVHELRQAIRAHLGKERAAQIAARALALEQAMPKATAYERLLAALRKVAGDDAELVLELLGE